jgi:putative ABC transport system substrate-binding protein
MWRREFIAGLGGVVAWPLAARAQQATMPVIGLLDWGFPRQNAPFMAAFHEGLAGAGYVEGRNVAIEYHWANTQGSALRALAEVLVHRQVAAIVAVGSTGPAHAAKAATSTIPIVFVYDGDPERDGLVGSLNRPGRNMTGVASFSIELQGKRLGLLSDLVPRAKIFAFLSGDSRYMHHEEQQTEIIAAADRIERQVVILEVRGPRDFEAAFTMLIQRQAEALVVGAFAFGNAGQISALAARHKIPTIYPWRAMVERAGGLMSYGAVVDDMFRQAGIYTGRILKGEKPVDLPVVRANKFEFVINLKTANALGLTIPETLLATADKLIE